ncbi:hypothetical protein KY335_03170 [Candidatus Woesearchaeota archaeon]|nr:hypothetical protein [Candidatus Woesearchaeota archaeon]MBW3014218.1 hypothetical protein [Candidatus Woesearchaeota archaeon]
MVLNIEKLKEKNRLAKSLVERGLATSFEDASAKIDQGGLVHNAGKLSTDDTPLENLKKRAIGQVRENEIREIEKETLEQKKQEVAKIAASDPKVLERLEKIEKFLGDFKAFFDKYRSMNDNNLKELASNIKSIRADMSAASSAPKVKQQTLQEQHPRQPELKRKPEAENSDTTRASFDTSEYSVEKVFSNANGRLAKKKPC